MCPLVLRLGGGARVEHKPESLANKDRFKTDIFFHFGGLDLYPAQ